MYLSSDEMSQLSTDDDSFDWNQRDDTVNTNNSNSKLYNGRKIIYKIKPSIDIYQLMSNKCYLCFVRT